MQGARSPRVGVIHLRVGTPCRHLEGGLEKSNKFWSTWD